MEKFAPNCRYGHGDLIQVTMRGAHPHWGYVSQKDNRYNFSGDLYLCTRVSTPNCSTTTCPSASGMKRFDEHIHAPNVRYGIGAFIPIWTGLIAGFLGMALIMTKGFGWLS